MINDPGLPAPETQAQLKRVFECFTGDPEFRRQALACDWSDAGRQRLTRIGVPFALEALGFLAAMGEFPDPFHLARRDLPRLEPITHAYPLLSAWLAVVAPRERGAGEGRGFSRHPALNAWRARRLAAARGELGILDADLLSPVLAIELSDGCGGGCWFCAFAPHRLRGVLDYRAQRSLFQSIVHGCLDLMGPEIGPLTLLYHGTEPHDHPDYLAFLSEFETLTDSRVFTSTAVADDPDWVARLLRHDRARGGGNLRLNILATETLHRLHDSYSPAALAKVELAMRIQGTGFDFAASGRLLKGISEGQHPRDLRDLAPGADPHSLAVRQGTIACLTGVKINPLTGEIQLLAPCHACRRWPLGYRVHDQIGFSGAGDFKRALALLLERATPLTPPAGRRLSFRDDLRYRPSARGFDLISPRQIHHFYQPTSETFAHDHIPISIGSPICSQLGALIATGDMTAREITQRLAAEQNMNPLLVAAAIRALFDGGFIDELHDRPRRFDPLPEASHGSPQTQDPR